MSQTAEKVTPIDGTPDGELARGMNTQSPESEHDSPKNDGIWDAKTEELLTEYFDFLDNLADKREELNASKAAKTAKLKDIGFNITAVLAAYRYSRLDDNKRENFDLSLLYARKVSGHPLQDDLFVAAAQKQVDMHQDQKH